MHVQLKMKRYCVLSCIAAIAGLIWHGFSETYMLVLTAAVSHSPATPTGSRPVDSWFRKWGCPVYTKTIKLHG